ncbi:MAG: 2-phospho-L-lactate transferase CofD family protein [Promethearchaeota archaeon]
MITIVSGGLRTTRFLEGLLRVIPQEDLAVIANTINNINVLGLEIYPDLEYLIFLLAGKLDIRYWETIQGDTYSFMDALSVLMDKEDLWFRFGDIIFSHVIVRKHLMATGKSFSEAIEIIKQKLGIVAKVLPMTSDKVVFKVTTEQGDMPFLEYRNKELQGLIKEVKKIEYDGIKDAKANSKIEDTLSKSDAIVIGPSNPPLNIEPMLAFQDIKNAIEKAACSVIAISPVLGDEPIDQPMRRLMEEAIGIGTGIIDIVERYPGLIDTLVIDENDEKYKEQLEDLGMEVIVTKVRIGTQENRIKLAEIVAKLI